MNELIKELRETIKGRCCDCEPDYGHICICCKIEEILSRHSKDTEPLAVLADRKGYWIAEFPMPLDNKCVRVRKGKGIGGIKSFIENTYSSAEAKARQYLNGLPDKAVEIVEKIKGQK